MKRFLLILVLTSINLIYCLSQDRIITTDNDTVDCKITRVSKSRISFIVFTNNIETKGEIPRANVLSYTDNNNENVYQFSDSKPEEFSKLSILLTGGGGYLLGSSEKAEQALADQGFSSDMAESYYSRLKSGLLFSGAVVYHIRKEYGVGLNYKFFNTSSHIEGLIDPNDGMNLYYTTYSENIYTNFAGASFVYYPRLRKEGPFRLYSSYTLGWTFYRNEAEYLETWYLLKGSNIGFDLGIGLEYQLTSSISLFSNLSVFYSNITKVRITDGTNSATVELEKENYENLSRIDLSLGIKFYMFKR